MDKTWLDRRINEVVGFTKPKPQPEPKPDGRNDYIANIKVRCRQGNWRTVDSQFSRWAQTEGIEAVIVHGPEKKAPNWYASYTPRIQADLQIRDALYSGFR